MTDIVFERLFSTVEPGFSISGSGNEFLSALELYRRVTAIASILCEAECRTVALYADNGADWIISDFSCQLADVRVVPLPLFFSDEQLQSCIDNSGADALLTDQPHRLLSLLKQKDHVEEVRSTDQTKLFTFDADPLVQLPTATSKITFTSGTTGRPKGVCLTAAQQLEVAESLLDAVGIERPRHLCLLPLSTLLENVAGVYAPLLAGGQVIAPSLTELGLIGSSGLDIGRLLENISHYQPESIILVPEMLHALINAVTNGWTPPTSLNFIAVGGGKTATGLLRLSEDVGLPVYEGYGLSECASVVSLNRPGSNVNGSVGRPLNHTDIHIEDGEIVVDGSTFLGYAGQPESWYQKSVHTGDIGHFDTDGHLYIDGRKKNLLISSFGRNISPEWVESELLSGELLLQAVVFGDAQPYCVALVAPRNATTTDLQVDTWIAEVNEGLPDYARIVKWHRLSEPFSIANGLMTENGRPRRDLMVEQFDETLTEIFDRSGEAFTV